MSVDQRNLRPTNVKSEQDQLTSLHKQRGALKRKVRDLSNLVSELSLEDENGQVLPLNRQQIIELQQRVNNFEPILERIEEIQVQIYALTVSDDDEEQNWVSDFEASYFKALSSAKTILEESLHVNKTGEGSSSPAQSVHAESTNSSRSNSRIKHLKLPPISLPKFDGRYTAWLEFHDYFNSMIHQDEELNEVQKFHYLKACLETDAADIIKNIQVTGANYAIAWKLICDRFTNKKLLVQHHMRSLFQLKETSKESPKQLRELIDATITHLRSLEALGQPILEWDPFIIYLVTSKFDKVTARDWENYKTEGDLPTFEELKTFVRKKADMLDNLTFGSSDLKQGNKFTPKPQRAYVSSNLSCYYCKDSHAIYNCEKFLKLSVQDRIDNVKRLKLCISCLRNSHTLENCNSKNRGCRKCKRNHNSLLHVDQAKEEPKRQKDEKPEPTTTIQSFSSQVSVSSQQVLLATALIQIKDNRDVIHECRALLDSGSQSNFITRELRDKLGLKQSKVNMMIQGINQVSSPIRHQCTVKIKSRVNSFLANLNCLVLDKISDDLPELLIGSTLKIPDNLELADPQFNTSGKIDLLIGAQLFWAVLSQGQVKLGDNLPILQNSKFGWILSGPLSLPLDNSRCFLTKTSDIQEQLQRFWELEECPSMPSWSNEQQLAESHFRDTFYQTETGRCVVSIPFKDTLAQLGESQSIATKRFFSMERKLTSDPVLQYAYVKFMNEYEEMGHMSLVKNPDLTQLHCYLPHHGVINTSSTTTKLRVVYDGSCLTSSGLSLNEVQMVGPTVQDLLFNILVRFRQHPIAISADVQKMYRQVEIHPNDTKFQRILWRKDKLLPLQTYELKTVTYGTASAPFLATRCLIQIANEKSAEFPKACNVIRSDFYVDDLLSGAETTEEATILCQQIHRILDSMKFPLHKWTSNDSTVINNLKDSLSSHEEIQIGSGDMTKTLGLYWLPKNDTLNYKISSSQLETITKRSILSELSQIFDPLGLLSACTIIGKVILQQLWQIGVGWDDELPTSIVERWLALRTNLHSLNTVQIPRHVMCVIPSRIELHCFSDASEIAYGACIFIKTIDSNGKSLVSLLCSKAKVAPIKKLTIPRLELCGAQLSANLMTTVKSALRLEIDQVYMWCDSTIVLAWLKSSPNILKVFVSHRVSEIQTKCKEAKWLHVPTKDNPADLASRGAMPSQLMESKLWWHGPSWLLRDSAEWPSLELQETSLESLPETKRVETVLVSTRHDLPIIDITRFSNWNRLIRATAYCFRFVHNIKRKPRCSGPLQTNELQHAEVYLIQSVQGQVWNKEIQCLQSNKQLPNSSSLLSFAPLLDEKGLLRVGGRLQLSNLEFSQKHQLLLPKHYLTELLFRHEHNRLAHAGPQQLLYSLREKFWPINGRNYSRLTLHKCVRCFRCRPKNTIPSMGILPAHRVQPAAPFQIVGVDYAGPYSIKDRQGRGSKVTKCYIALYVCFAIKAVHIELVTSLSTAAFMASLRRFISRRGKPTNIYSDNGSNFVGTNNELKLLVDRLRSDEKEIVDSLSTENITWSFIPPHSPNFGGLWEAGVKSLKFHLKRVVGDALLTFEQFYTLLCQIEAVLNSRPLSPMSSNPNDLEPITPAHFLIGRRLTALPEPSLLQLPVNRLAEFERVQKLLQHWWNRWKSEYLHTLQQRKKWQQPQPNLTVGTMVILKDDNTTPLCWPIGRITETFPGQDNQVRVVSVKTCKGTYKRAASKVYPLPICVNDTEHHD